MKITAYKDINGNIHESKILCEIANLAHELGVTEVSHNVFDITNLQEVIENGKKAQRLIKLYESKQSNSK